METKCFFTHQSPTSTLQILNLKKTSGNADCTLFCVKANCKKANEYKKLIIAWA